MGKISLINMQYIILLTIQFSVLSIYRDAWKSARICYSYASSLPGPLTLLLEFCSGGTLENSLRDTEKAKLLFKMKTKIHLVNEIARGMRHLADARVNNSVLLPC